MRPPPSTAEPEFENAQRRPRFTNAPMVAWFQGRGTGSGYDPDLFHPALPAMLVLFVPLTPAGSLHIIGTEKCRTGTAQMVGINLEARIRERAYEIWEREGRPHGKHLEHWRRAKQEVEAQAEQGDLKRSVERPNPAPRMQPSSVAAAQAPSATQPPGANSAAAGTETAAKEAKRTVKRKQTQSEAKAPRTRRSKTSPPKSTT